MVPVPIKRLREVISFTDGHTRAFLAWKRGLVVISAYWDDSELDVVTYLRCLDWCKEAGIHSIADLASHIITEAEYKVKWIARCEAIDSGGMMGTLHNRT